MCRPEQVAAAALAEMFDEMERVRVKAKKDLDLAISRAECRKIATLVGKTLGLGTFVQIAIEL
jgi:hypothetical protein